MLGEKFMDDLFNVAPSNGNDYQIEMQEKIKRMEHQISNIETFLQSNQKMPD